MNLLNYIVCLISSKGICNMKKLGISIYPDRTTFEENKAYLELAAGYGFSRVFLNLLSVSKEILENFKKILTIIKRYANS